MEGMAVTVVICVVLGLVCVLGVRSYLKKLKSGCCGSGGDEVKRVRPLDRNVNHYPYVKVVQIDGMHCQNCAKRIENAFNTQDGFFAKVNLAKQRAIVRSKREVPDRELKQAVRNVGYSPVTVEDLK